MPVLSTALRKRAGMTWSVSTLSTGNGTTLLLNGWNGATASALRCARLPRRLRDQRAGVGDAAGERGRRGGQRAGQEGPPPGPLAALEVAVGGGHRVLARLELGA